MSDHPKLAYIQPLNSIEPPTLIAVSGENRVAVPLTGPMLIQLVEQCISEIGKLYGPSKPPRHVD